MILRLFVFPGSKKCIFICVFNIIFLTWDDYEKAYDNTWESIPENDLDVLQKCLDSEDEIFIGMMDTLLENQSGVYINGTWYDWDEIKHLWEII